MSSEFNFTVTSWFLENVRIKPYFKTQWGSYAIKASLSVLLLRIFACQALPEPAQKSYINWEDSNNQRPFYSVGQYRFWGFQHYTVYQNILTQDFSLDFVWTPIKHLYASKQIFHWIVKNLALILNFAYLFISQIFISYPKSRLISELLAILEFFKITNKIIRF